MNLPTPRNPARIGWPPLTPWLTGRPAASLLPKRTTVARKKRREKPPQQPQHIGNSHSHNTHDFPPADPGVEQDGVIGEADRPPPPSDKPQA